MISVAAPCTPTLVLNCSLVVLGIVAADLAWRHLGRPIRDQLFVIDVRRRKRKAFP
jgi:hypothetical protein